MPALYHGNASTLTPISGANFYYEENLGVLDQPFEIRKDLAFSKAPANNVAHPIFSAFKHDIKRMKIVFHEATAILTCSYLSSTPPGGGGVTTLDPIYELIGGVSSEPIETHPNFVSSIGGKKGTVLNKAIFDEQGRFIGFPPDADHDLGGVSSFLSPSLTWRETQFTSSATISGVAALGTINAPSGGAPGLSSPRNWILVSFTQRKQGLNYQQGKEWRSSGPRGWNSLIY